MGQTLSSALTAYVLTQILVGAELGIAIAFSVVFQGWSLAGAMSLMLPIGLPLVVLHLSVWARMAMPPKLGISA